MSDVQGGAALPAAESDAPATGRTAIPVALVADGRPVQAGSARPVVQVSDAQLASGAYVLAGGAPAPLALVSDGRPTLGGPAQPVYVVGGGPAPGSPLEAAILGFSPYAYWPLDEASGATAADASGNGYDGAYEGAVTPGGTFAPFTAPTFAGGSVDLFSAGLAAAYSGDVGTVLAFARPAAFGPGRRTVLGLAAGDGSALAFYAASNSGDNFYGADRRITGNTGGFPFADLTTGADRWYMVALTVNAGANQQRITVYLDDGTLITGPLDSAGGTWPGDLVSIAIGGAGGAPVVGAFAGQLAHVALFDTVLTADDLAAIYAASGL